MLSGRNTIKDLGQVVSAERMGRLWINHSAEHRKHGRSENEVASHIWKFISPCEMGQN